MRVSKTYLKFKEIKCLNLKLNWFNVKLIKGFDNRLDRIYLLPWHDIFDFKGDIQMWSEKLISKINKHVRFGIDISNIILSI